MSKNQNTTKADPGTSASEVNRDGAAKPVPAVDLSNLKPPLSAKEPAQEIAMTFDSRNDSASKPGRTVVSPSRSLEQLIDTALAETSAKFDDRRAQTTFRAASTARAETAQNFESAVTREDAEAAKVVVQGGKGEQSPSKKQGLDPMLYINVWSKNTSSFRNLLNTSKGRDKFS